MLKQLKRFSMPCLGALLALSLSACDSSSGTGTPPPRTVLEPIYDQFVQDNVQIQFPPPVSQTQADSLTVRGIVQNADNIERLHLNGVDATSDDGWATWTVQMPLDQGLNTLQLVAEDAEGNSENLSQLLVTRQTDLVSARKIRLDRTNNRLLALDFSERAIVAVDLDSGDRSVFSPPEGSENLISAPRELMVHESSNSVLVAQAGNEPIISVDLTTGMQEVLVVTGLENLNWQATSQAMTPSATGAYVAGRELVYRRSTTTTETNEDGEEVEVTIIERVEDADDANIATLSTGFIYHLDLMSKERTLVSNFDTEDAGRRLSNDIRSISTTLDSDVIYVLERFQLQNQVQYAIMAVDKITGRREDFELVFPEPETEEDSEEPVESPAEEEGSAIPDEDLDQEEPSETVAPPPELTLAAARELQLDTANNRLWLLTAGRNLGKIDLSTREGELVAAPTVPADTDFPLLRAESLALDEYEQRIYLSDISYGRIVSVNVDTGERSLLSSSGPADPDGTQSFFGPSAVTLDLLNHQVFVTDQAQRAIYRYNLLDGTKTALAQRNTVDGDVPINFPLSADFDNLSGRLTVFDNPRQAPVPRTGDISLINVDPDSGSNNRVFRYNVNITARDALYDPHSEAYFILEQNLLRRIVIDEAGSARPSLMSGGNTPNRNNPFSANLRSMVLDPANERILVLDMTRRAVIAADWDTGERTYLSRAPTSEDSDDGLVRFQIPLAMSLDPLRDRVLVLDSGLKAIVAVDLETGERTIVASNQGVTRDRLITPRSIAAHPIYNYALIVDDTRNVLMAVDLVTNERVTLSR